MSVPAPFQPIGELLERSLNIRHVYGEPVRHGDITVIPVARVAYGFGAGAGSRQPGAGRSETSASGEATRPEAQGGGGGGARLTPVGALEIGPHGTRFIRYRQRRELLGAFAVGLGAGLLVARRHL